MRVAVISDIHGNLEAFHAVIGDLEITQPDEVFCLGDIIGYGPDPQEVVSLFRLKGYHSVLGNHEAALQTKKMRAKLNFQARENSEQTEDLLSKENINFCCALKKQVGFAGALFVHGFPPSSVIKYVTRIGESEISEFLQQSKNTFHFVGHSHELHHFSWQEGKFLQKPLKKGSHQLSPSAKHIINVGSVGQPRDGNNNAKYVLWDSTENIIDVRFVPYDIATTIQKITDRGFPKAYALRLQ